MMLFRENEKDIDVKSCIDCIENEIYQKVKVFGFRKHGRTLHRFVDGDISQVIDFQCGQSYRHETNHMWVNIGIRVPECEEKSFEVKNTKRYYHEYECNLRTRVGTTDQDALDSRSNPNQGLPQGTTYDLKNDLREIIKDISLNIMQDVIPVFDILSNREAILKHRREYPRYDITSHRLILLDEAMIYGRKHDLDKARELFEEHYQYCRNETVVPKEHFSYLDALALKLGLRKQ